MTSPHVTSNGTKATHIKVHCKAEIKLFFIASL